jgi:hypothetical protein
MIKFKKKFNKNTTFEDDIGKNIEYQPNIVMLI